MTTEETPDRCPKRPPTDHHFETPKVREARPAPAADEKHDDGACTGPEPQRRRHQETAFQHRWENVQTTFVARADAHHGPV